MFLQACVVWLVADLWKQISPLKTNVALENRPFQKETSRPTIDFQGLCCFQGVRDHSKILSRMHLLYTLSETNKSQLPRTTKIRIASNHPLSGAMLVSERIYIHMPFQEVHQDFR